MGARSRLREMFLVPAALLMLATLVAPLLVIVAYSFLSRGAYGGVELPWTFENYTRFWDWLYVVILWRSIWVAAVTTLLCLVMGFPLAMFIARSGARKNFWLSLVILPFWTSFLIRTYAWMFLLRDTGLVNTALMGLGLIPQPLPMLYNDGAVILGLVYGYLPFMVLPLYATLERLDPALLEAASDLGASSRQVLWRVTIPLSGPGMRAGALLVFIPSLGTYLTSDLLGGSKTVLIGNLVQTQFTASRDWPFGAAAALMLIAFAVALLMVFRKQVEELV